MTDEEELLNKDIQVIMNIMVFHQVNLENGCLDIGLSSDKLTSRILSVIKSKISIDSYINVNYMPRNVGNFDFMVAPNNKRLTATEFEKYMYKLSDKDSLITERVTISNGNGSHILHAPLRIFYFYKLDPQDYVKFVTYKNPLEEVHQINGTLL
jgi:hypothetical protein